MININLKERLPDINSYTQLEKTPFEQYGRLAILTDNSFWIGQLSSSHPLNTLEGFYFAKIKNTIYISGRGTNNINLINEKIINFLLKKIKINNKDIRIIK
jgi:hypothetical protein